jgi:hypothetical protein
VARTLAQVRADIRGLAGLTKATPAEIDTLINEGHKELCVRAGWTRANLELGPTVIGQAAYALGATVYGPLKVKVNGVPYDPSSEQEADRIIDGDLRLASDGIFWISQDAAGVESVSIYPTPGTAGLSIIANAVVYPAELVDEDDPVRVPDDFVKGIRAYVKSQVYSATEDDEDRAQIQTQAFENEVIRLRQHRFSRVGQGNVHMKIEGWTA